jgi:hypothetical protein
VTQDSEVFAQTLARAEAIVKHEWAQFQQVHNEGGRAACQDDAHTFRQMRLSQFLAWTLPLLDSYAQDLQAADAAGRNLLTEKYGRMMESTEPARFAAEIEPHVPRLDAARVSVQEQIIATQVRWAADFRERYPRLGGAMRVLTSAQDTRTDTSFETYLRGELGTYSDRTLALYQELVQSFLDRGRNLTDRTVSLTVALAGYPDLQSAEAAQEPS